MTQNPIDSKKNLLHLARTMREIEASQDISEMQKTLLQESVRADKELFYEQDSEGNTFLSEINWKFKKALLNALDEARGIDYEEKVEALLSFSIRQREIAVLDETGQLEKECLLNYLLNQGVSSFERLEKVGLLLTCKVPGCRLAKSVFNYYYETHELTFCQYLISCIDNLSKHGIDRANILSTLVTMGVALPDIGWFFKTSIIAIDSSELPLSALKNYISAQAKGDWERLSKYTEEKKIFNSLFLFEHLNDQEVILENIQKPFYPLAFDRQGKNIIHLLAERGHEEMVVALLKEYEIKKALVIYDEHKETLWHLCVRHGLQKILNYLIESQSENIYCIDYRFATPFVLAVELGYKKTANILWDQMIELDSFQLNQRQSVLPCALLTKNKELIMRCKKWGLFGAICVDALNADDYSALWNVMQEEDQEMIALLASCPRIQEAILHDMKIALRKKDKEGVKKYIQLGLSQGCPLLIEMPDGYGYTGLFYAAQTKDKSFYDYVLHHCHASDRALQRDLWNALQRGNREEVEICIRLTDLNKREVNDYTALDWARIYKRKEIIPLIEEAGGEAHLCIEEVRKLRHLLVTGKTFDEKGRPTNKLVLAYHKNKKEVTLSNPVVFKISGLLLAGFCLYTTGIFSFAPVAGVLLTLIGGIASTIGITHLAQYAPLSKRIFARTDKEIYKWDYEVSRKYALSLARGLHNREQQNLIDKFSSKFWSTKHPVFCSSGSLLGNRTEQAKLTQLREQIPELEKVAKKKHAKSLKECEERVSRKARYRYF